MGTLSQPVMTLTTAYSHPLLPTTQYIVSKPAECKVKRSLGTAVTRDEMILFEILREESCAQWEKVWEYIWCGKWREARRKLMDMSERLDKWVDQGRNETEEFNDMKLDVMKTIEFVLTKLLEKEGLPVARIAVPQPVVQREVGRTRPQSLWSSNAKKACPGMSGVSASSSPGSNLSYISPPAKSDGARRSPRKSLSHRRESEKLVEEAIIRGAPVTLFHDEDVVPQTTLEAEPSTPTRNRPADSASLQDTRNSRDLTPTPYDPFSLRLLTPSPRKKASIYSTPRWPRGGRPSPKSPTRAIAITGRATFGTSEGSIYDELDFPAEDPAEEIWRGINEEYSSPGGGRFTRWRRLRREGSVIRGSRIE